MERFVIVVVICLGLFSFGSAEPRCHLSEAFACLEKPVAFINTLPKRSIPTTSEEVGNLCKALDDGYSCIGDYQKRCMTPIQRELVKLTTEGFEDLLKSFCGSPNSKLRAEYLSHAQCLNKVTQGEVTHKNIEYLLAVSQRFTALPYAQRFSYLCCGYAKIYHNIRSEMVRTCGEEATKSIEDVYDMALAQLPNLLCTGYDASSPDCTRVLPPDGAKPSDEFKTNAVYEFFHNMLKNFLE